ncbi:MAG: hypothetical protein NW207_05100 [Cytophagales bacterium]|nr:hypothetical protein [Cytophagales bacterium]
MPIKKRWLKISLSIFIFIIIFILGYQRRAYDHFFADLYRTPQSYYYQKAKYPDTFTEWWYAATHHYKWLQSVTYTVLYIAATLALVAVNFDRNTWLITIAMYVALGVLVCIFISLSWLTKDYVIGYKMAQNIKKVIQSPLPGMCLYVVYTWLHKNDNSRKQM